MSSTNYPSELLKYVEGRVEDTLATASPDRISLLRLDTDFYTSTRVELEVLYPKLERGGVFIVDDYGWWAGARKAVDEYFNSSGFDRPYFVRIDEGRVGIKL